MWAKVHVRPPRARTLDCDLRYHDRALSSGEEEGDEGADLPAASRVEWPEGRGRRLTSAQSRVGARCARMACAKAFAGRRKCKRVSSHAHNENRQSAFLHMAKPAASAT
eukprot:1522467-Prymnesium_polylepis.2